MKRAVCLLGVFTLLLLLLSGAEGEPRYKSIELARKNQSTVLRISREPDKALLWTTSSPRQYTVVIWQVPAEQTTDAHAETLMEWVRGGGHLVFQDCRLARYFGMESAPINRKEFSKSAIYNGGLAAFKEGLGQHGESRTAPGCYAILKSAGGYHEVLDGVTLVGAFLLQVGPDEYSGVRRTDSVIPLLRVPDDKGSLTFDKLASAMLLAGNGTVSFKPFVISQLLDGDRLQTQYYTKVYHYKDDIRPTKEETRCILIVTDRSRAAHKAFEETAVEEAGKSRLVVEGRLPILTLHFDKPTERVYCEKTLGIRASALPLIGLAQQHGGVVVRVERRFDNVTDAREIFETLDREPAQKEAGY